MRTVETVALVFGTAPVSTNAKLSTLQIMLSPGTRLQSAKRFEMERKV
jgi:hypothetical protein